jgi:LmbE family N-acetylglucosaminyl deacetylase
VLLEHVARGDKVLILLLTAGRDDEDAVSGTKAAREAASILGAEIALAEPGVSAVPDLDDLIDFLASLVEKEKPEILYAPSRNDVRESRQNAYRAVAMGASEVPNIYCYQAATTTLDFRPTIFRDVKEYMDQKMVVLSAYKTQAEGRPHLRPEMARATAQYWGRFLGYGEVEPMEVRQTRE